MDKNDFKTLIKTRLSERNEKESLVNKKLIFDYEIILCRFNSSQKQLDTLKYENEKLRSSVPVSNDQTISRKVYDMQEELTNAVKEKSAMNIKLLEYKLLCNNKDKDIQDLKQNMISFKDQISRQEDLIRTSSDTIRKLEDIKRTLTDEISANLMAYRSLDTKYRELEESSYVLKDTVKKLQQALEDKKNEEYDSKYKATQDAIKQTLIEAANSTVDIDLMKMKNIYITNLPCQLKQTLDAHEGEMGCVRFSPSGMFLATSGSDRKIKIWSHNFGTCDYKTTLTGCNGSVIAVDFDSSESFILGASTLDSSCRLWSMGDFRMRLSLTGHSNKVVAGRFLADNTRIVTGSTDRTLKLWDTRTRSCVKTMLAMSACHDVVVCSSLGLMISGHFDKKLRMWDHRGDLNTDQLILPGRITGLDISRDQNVLLACLKDDSLQTIDLRMNQFIQNFTAPQFKPCMDLVRPCFSPDGQYVAAGSNDGSVFIWNSRTGKLEKTLKDQTAGIICVHWCPGSNVLASCERNKRVAIWGE